MNTIPPTTGRSQYVPMHGFKNCTGDDLYQSGYRTYVADSSRLFVRKPDGSHYLVNPLQQTCTCPARKTCKHLAGLIELVFLSVGDLEYRGNKAEARRLLEFWFQYTVALYKQREEVS